MLLSWLVYTLAGFRPLINALVRDTPMHALVFQYDIPPCGHQYKQTVKKVRVRHVPLVARSSPSRRRDYKASLKAYAFSSAHGTNMYIWITKVGYCLPEHGDAFGLPYIHWVQKGTQARLSCKSGTLLNVTSVSLGQNINSCVTPYIEKHTWRYRQQSLCIMVIWKTIDNFTVITRC